MKKLLIASSLVLSMSYVSSSYAETATIGAAVAESTAFSTTTAVVTATAVTVGTIALAAGAGYGTVKVMNNIAFSNCRNDGACDAGAMGTAVGAVFGTGSSFGILMAAGPSMSGLTAIGSSVGGGAVAGACMLIAAPVVTAAVFGTAYYYWNVYSPSLQTISIPNGSTGQ